MIDDQEASTILFLVKVNHEHGNYSSNRIKQIFGISHDEYWFNLHIKCHEDDEQRPS